AIRKIVKHASQSRKTFKRPKLKKFVEQVRRWLVLVDARAAEKRHRPLESVARPGSRGGRRDGRFGHNGGQKPFRRGFRAPHVNKRGLSASEPVAKLLQQRGAAAPAAAEQHRNPRGRSVQRCDNPSGECDA